MKQLNWIVLDKSESRIKCSLVLTYIIRYIVLQDQGETLVKIIVWFPLDPFSQGDDWFVLFDEGFIKEKKTIKSGS